MNLEAPAFKGSGAVIDVLREASERRYGPEWGIEQPGDVAEGQRNLLHFLQGGLYSHMEADPARPVFRRIVTNTRKFRGDNPDAIYFDAHVRGDLEYLVRGHMAGAVYFSVTIEEGPGEAHYATGTAAGLNDSEMDIAADGSFEIFVSANDPGDGRNWLRLSPTAQSITTMPSPSDGVWTRRSHPAVLTTRQRALVVRSMLASRCSGESTSRGT